MKRLLPALFAVCVTVSTANAAVRTNVVERSYDRFGRIVGLSVDGERRSEIAYDGATERIASMRVAGADEPFRWEYESGSDLKKSLRYPNGARVTWEYEPHRDFVTLVSNDVYSSFRYAYDAAGRRVSMYTHSYYPCVIDHRRRCESYARIYYFAVDKLGKDAYNRAQEGCCHEKK